MVRDLFKSERRVIRNIAVGQWGTEIEASAGVVGEWYPSEKTGAPHFNSDFDLQLDKRDLGTLDFMSGMAPILPNTLGAEVFLSVEKGSYKPLLLELMGGEAFPMKYFATYIRDVEMMLSRISAPARKPGLTRSDPRDPIEASGLLPGSIKEVSVKQSAYSRILVVGSDICFLVFPDATSPVMRSVRHTLVRSPQCEVDCYLSGSEIACLDGWVSTQVPTSEHKLAATWEPLE